MENKEDIRKLKDQITANVKAVSVKNFGICTTDGTWHNIDKRLDDKEKENLEVILGNIFKGDKVIINKNSAGYFYYIKKLESVSEEEKIKVPKSQYGKGVVEAIITEKGEIWEKCLLAILTRLPNQEQNMTSEFLDAILPSTNSLFIETNKTLRERR